MELFVSEAFFLLLLLVSLFLLTLGVFGALPLLML